MAELEFETVWTVRTGPDACPTLQAVPDREFDSAPAVDPGTESVKSETDDAGPGFGIAGGLAGIATASYLVARWGSREGE